MKRKLSTLTKRLIGGGLVALLALVGGLFYATRPAQAAFDPISLLRINGTYYYQTALAANPSGTGWAYTRSNNTLTLTNFTNTAGTDIEYADSGGTSASGLNVHLIGANTINGGIIDAGGGNLSITGSTGGNFSG